jgi:hypothetical protein
MTVCSLTMEARMASFPSVSMRNASEDSEIWANLREAIANSSGFQGWKQQQSTDLVDLTLDKQVRLYLRETLETLAY